MGCLRVCLCVAVVLAVLPSEGGTFIFRRHPDDVHHHSPSRRRPAMGQEDLSQYVQRTKPMREQIAKQREYSEKIALQHRQERAAAANKVSDVVTQSGQDQPSDVVTQSGQDQPSDVVTQLGQDQPSDVVTQSGQDQPSDVVTPSASVGPDGPSSSSSSVPSQQSHNNGQPNSVGTLDNQKLPSDEVITSTDSPYDNQWVGSNQWNASNHFNYNSGGFTLVNSSQTEQLYNEPISFKNKTMALEKNKFTVKLEDLNLDYITNYYENNLQEKISSWISPTQPNDPDNGGQLEDSHSSAWASEGRQFRAAASSSKEKESAPVGETTTDDEDRGTPEHMHHSEEHRLVDWLFDGYNRHIRPTVNAGDVTEVEFELALLNILNLDTRYRKLLINCEMILKWHDTHLAWHPSDFGGVAHLRVPYYDIWTPDIILHNTAESDYEGSILNTYAIIESTGEIELLSHALFNSICAVDVQYYPFDEQTCALTFSSWTYDKTGIVLVEGPSAITHFVENPEFVLENFYSHRTEEFNECCVEAFIIITFYVQVQRRTKFAMFFYIMPGILINVCAVMVFSLPAETGEKVGLGINSLLAMIVFLMAMTEDLPPTDNLPLAGIYYGVCLTVITTNIAFSVFVLNLNFMGFRGFKVPSYVKSFSLFVAKFMVIKVPSDVVDAWKIHAQGEALNQLGVGGSFPPDGLEKNIIHVFSPDEHSSGGDNNNYNSHNKVKSGLVKAGLEEQMEPQDAQLNDPYQRRACRALENMSMLMTRGEKRYKEDKARSNLQEEWKFISRVLDRFLFVLFFFIAFFFNIIILTGSPHFIEYEYCPYGLDMCEGMTEQEIKELVIAMAHHTNTGVAHGASPDGDGGGHGDSGDGGHGGGGDGGGGHGGGGGDGGDPASSDGGGHGGGAPPPASGGHGAPPPANGGHGAPPPANGGHGAPPPTPPPPDTGGGGHGDGGGGGGGGHH